MLPKRLYTISLDFSILIQLMMVVVRVDRVAGQVVGSCGQDADRIARLTFSSDVVFQGQAVSRQEAAESSVVNVTFGRIKVYKGKLKQRDSSVTVRLQTDSKTDCIMALPATKDTLKQGNEFLVFVNQSKTNFLVGHAEPATKTTTEQARSYSCAKCG